MSCRSTGQPNDGGHGRQADGPFVRLETLGPRSGRLGTVPRPGSPSNGQTHRALLGPRWTLERGVEHALGVRVAFSHGWPPGPLRTPLER